ncbi:protein rolling stone-like [Plakobranchus ocellatus]|uniref:Protein rolling stone-like n=1 Tax=Plakobranchus ocellatus TaxID=259542 RepID=A0AAV3Z638_9GAST|nr:protein rolling stone-like [Plakobranchus ocellatus]
MSEAVSLRSGSGRSWPGSLTMSFRDEFRLSRFGFQDTCRERFLTFHWRAPGILYILYRLGLACYTLAILSQGIIHQESLPNQSKKIQAWLAYLTNWTYILLTVYFCYHALVTLAVYHSCQGLKLKIFRRMDFTEHKYLFRELYVTSTGYQQATASEDDPMDIVDSSNTNTMPEGLCNQINDDEDDPMEIIDPSDRIPWYLCLLWILYNTATVFALVVTIVFWGALAPRISLSRLASAENLQFHMVNSALVLIELCLTAIPVRFLHVVYPFAYGVAYGLFSVIYWAVDHKHVMYPILDWSKSPGIAAACVLLIGFVLVPVLQLLIYGVHRLKLAIFRRFCWN